VKFTWNGVTFEGVDKEDLTWMEMEELEGAAGVTSGELEDPKIAGRARVGAAFLWLSLRRESKDVTFAEFFASKVSALEAQEEPETPEVQPPPDDPADPTESTAAPELGSAT
jgi:hypothetical protein